MKSDSDTPEDEALMKRLKTLGPPALHPIVEARIRQAVFAQVESRPTGFIDWLFRPLWRPVLACLLPFATGLAFGQSDLLHESPLLPDSEPHTHLVTSFDAAHHLIRNYSDASDENDEDGSPGG